MMNKRVYPLISIDQPISDIRESPDGSLSDINGHRGTATLRAILDG